MKKTTITLLLALSVLALPSCVSGGKDTVSPNGKIRIAVEIGEDENSEAGQLFFTVEYGGKKERQAVLSHARLGLLTESQNFAENLKLVSVSDPVRIEDDYVMITGKRSHCVNQAYERTYRFENEQKQAFEVVFRAYDDGVVFRYQLPSGTTGFVTGEETVYPIAEGTRRWMQRYAVDYEGFFPLATNGEAARGRFPDLWGYPALVEPADGVFLLITEANMERGHSASRLYNGDNQNEYQVVMPDEKVAANGPWHSPWRVLIIGSLADVVESTLVTDVSEPNKVADTSWIVPGQAAWIYWAHNNGSRNFQLVKEYIDLAAEMGWTYDLIDADWDKMDNGGDLLDALAYAHGKGVKPLIWYNSGTNWVGPGAPGPIYLLNKKEDRLKEYAWLHEKGVAGIKVDFFAVDGAEMTDYYIDLLEDAIPYELSVNFHGATIPRGWQRTYPHMMTVEAVYGSEWYNNNPRLTEPAAGHNATLPFTRNVIGPMDYTPGTFSDSQHPHLTSHGHELALPVIFESGIQHMPDRPSVYRSLPEPVIGLLSDLPTAWDDTRLLAGYPGEDAVIARRKGEVWYIGGINGTTEAKTLRFTPDFLTGPATLTLFKDGADNRSFAIEENVALTDPSAPIEVPCLPRGGFVAVIK